MKKLAFSTAASLAALTMVSAPASAATEIVLTGDPTFLTGTFGETVVNGPRNFLGEYFFELPQLGEVTGTAGTITVRNGALGDIDFNSIWIEDGSGNQYFFDLTTMMTGGEEEEIGSLSGITLADGVYNLYVDGSLNSTSGSYTGSINFAAVPEPATWALMLLGFAAVGFSLRRRKPEARETRVRYNFA